MVKKYLGWLLFLVAAVLLFWIKSNQRGSEQLESSDRMDVERSAWVRQELEFSKHARCRMECREIDAREVKEILENGTINYSRIREDKKGKTIPVEGKTKDGQNVRIVFAPKQTKTVVVTVIDLDKEYKCDCS